jgi:hypothetical protein
LVYFAFRIGVGHEDWASVSWKHGIRGYCMLLMALFCIDCT